jgi:rubrerythrin
MKKYSRTPTIKQTIQKFKESILSAVTEFDSSKPDDQQILRISIASELSAINLYRTLADLTNNQLLKKALLDISKEEKTHIGEFEAILNEIDFEQDQENVNGKIEIENMKGEI